MVPMTLEQALQLAAKVRDVGVFGVMVMGQGGERDHAETAYSALVVVAEALAQAAELNGQLREVNEELVACLRAKIDEHLHPDAEIPPEACERGDTTVAWRGPSRAYWDNSGAINHEIAQEFGRAMRDLGESGGISENQAIEATSSETEPT